MPFPRLRLTKTSRSPRRSPAAALAAVAAPGLALAALLTSSSADAHFQLLNPPNPTEWIVEGDTLGDPQKAMPCGVDSQVQYTLTNKVTQYAPGQTIQLQFIETVAHDGWYRISLSYKDRADLTDPPYQTNSIGWSVDAGIENPPVAPVLVDGLYKHLASDITTPKTWPVYDLKLPMETCAKCTLQIEEIMLNHPVNQADGQFTYHHCADIAIVEGGDGGSVTMGDGGTVYVQPGSDDASTGGSSGESSSGSTGAGSTGTGDDSGESTGRSGAGTGASSGSGATGASGGSSDSGSSGSSSGCAASGRGTTAAAGFGLLVGAVIAGIRRRRRAAR